MKIAIMQPYLFPYIGYFQLVNAVDRFIFYDDVNFIKQGWINRNNILVNGQKYLFSLPVENISSYRKINDVKISRVLFDKRKNKLLKTIEMSYRKAKYFEDVFPMLKEVLEAGCEYVAGYAKSSVIKTMEYLGINTGLVDSSTVYHNENLNSSERVIDICLKEKASVYLNPAGGRRLYEKNEFFSHGIKLYFLQTADFEYPQAGKIFVPNLSVIDLMMNNSKAECRDFLKKYELI